MFAALASLCLLFGLELTCASQQSNESSAHHIDAQRLQASLEKLSEFGRNPEGGVTRTAYSETDMAAREYVMQLMKEAGLRVRVDAAGNIFGHRDGSEKLPVILFWLPH